MDNIKLNKRVVEDTLKIDGRTFKMHMMDPILGNYILMKLTTTVMPFGFGNKVNEAVGSNVAPVNAISGFANMGKQDYIEFQKDLLSTCTEVLPAGEAPIINDNGSYGVSNLTMKLVFQLMLATIAFNFHDFFEEDGSSNLPEDQPDM